MHIGVQDLLALLQVLVIDLVLAGDNALVVGLVVARLPARERRQAVIAGTLGAAALRLGLAAITVKLLAIVGLTLAGGFLLLWVCWKTARELRGAADHPAEGASSGLFNAMLRIIVADLSMSLDNVLAVAGAANGHPAWIMAVGLITSVVLMAVAASLIAKLLARYPAISWGGLAIIFFVSLKLIWEGSHQVIEAMI